jgi:hypothetical protein
MGPTLNTSAGLNIRGLTGELTSATMVQLRGPTNVEVDMKNPLAVATLIYAIAATATAQTLTPAPSETRGLSKTPFEVAQIEVRVPGGGVVVVSPGDGRTGVSYASVDLVCGGKTYTVSTGNKSGECKTGGNGNNGLCDDGHGNSAEVNCSSGCSSAKGSGSCAVK